MAHTTGKLVIEYVKLSDGSICILPSEAEARMVLNRIKSAPAGKSSEEKKAKALQDELAEDAFNAILEARKGHSDNITTLEVSYHPYTRRDKLEAKRLATTVSGDDGVSTIDQDEFEAHLISFSTSLSYDEVIDLPESIYRILSDKVFSGQSVSVERLNFFG